jgi:hypothetical protein
MALTAAIFRIAGEQVNADAEKVKERNKAF